MNDSSAVPKPLSNNYVGNQTEYSMKSKDTTFEQNAGSNREAVPLTGLIIIIVLIVGLAFAIPLIVIYGNSPNYNTSTGAPPVITNLLVTSVTSTGCVLSWTDTTPNVTFTIAKSTGMNATTIVSGLTDLTYTVTGLTPATPYILTVTEVGGTSTSPTTAVALTTFASS